MQKRIKVITAVILQKKKKKSFSRQIQATKEGLYRLGLNSLNTWGYNVFNDLTGST